MKWSEEDALCTLSSGRVLKAYGGTFGLPRVRMEPDEEPRDMLAYGYDNTVDLVIDGDDETPLTPDERHEIADEMIARWKAWGGL